VNKNNNIKIKIWIVIPAYNEENTIRGVVKSVSNIISSILVVNDGSTDKTSQYLNELSITTIKNKRNLGYTRSIEKGLRYAFEHGADYVITFDADGQHLASDLKKFFNVIVTKNPDYVVGNRSFKNRIIEKFFGLYTKKIFGFSDPFCGFKAYSKYFFEKMGKKLENNYSIGMERAFITLSKSQMRAIEINLTTLRRQDSSRFAGYLRGNLMELKAIFNILRSIYL